MKSTIAWILVLSFLILNTSIQSSVIKNSNTFNKHMLSMNKYHKLETKWSVGGFFQWLSTKFACSTDQASEENESLIKKSDNVATEITITPESQDSTDGKIGGKITLAIKHPLDDAGTLFVTGQTNAGGEVTVSSIKVWIEAGVGVLKEVKIGDNAVKFSGILKAKAEAKVSIVDGLGFDLSACCELCVDTGVAKLTGSCGVGIAASVTFARQGNKLKLGFKAGAGLVGGLELEIDLVQVANSINPGRQYSSVKAWWNGYSKLKDSGLIAEMDNGQTHKIEFTKLTNIDINGNDGDSKALKNGKCKKK